MGAIKSKARGLALTSKILVSVLSLFVGLMPQQGLAATSNDQFQLFMDDLCVNGIYPILPGWDVTKLTQMCFDYQNGLAAAGGFTNAANIGTSNAGSGAASRKKKGISASLEEQKEKPEKGASADGAGWGFLVAPMYGKGNRLETDLENGYQSDLKGLVIGLDYRFSDSFVLGGTIGQTKDNAAFLNNAGSLKTSSNTFTLYGTWIPSESTAVDGYLGYGKLTFDSQRHLVFGLISGLIKGSTSGQQVMAGMSASYQKDIGQVNLAPFINFDYIKTRINGYNESGTTLLELHFGDRSTISSNGSLGMRMSTSYGYDWGTLFPSARIAAVHEFQNQSKQIRNELVLTPGTGFLVATDAPDRNYLNIGLGVAAALNGGTQMFLDYEKRTQDRLLSSWAISAGVLLEL